MFSHLKICTLKNTTTNVWVYWSEAKIYHRNWNDKLSYIMIQLHPLEPKNGVPARNVVNITIFKFSM